MELCGLGGLEARWLGGWEAQRIGCLGAIIKSMFLSLGRGGAGRPVEDGGLLVIIAPPVWFEAQRFGSVFLISVRGGINKDASLRRDIGGWFVGWTFDCSGRREILFLVRIDVV